MHPRTIRSARIRCVTATGNSRESPSISDTTVLRDRLAGWAADRRVRWGAGIFGGLALGLVILIGAFPWGALKGVVEHRLGARYGVGVTIGSIHRTQFFPFTPTIEIRDVRIPQPPWAGSGQFSQCWFQRGRSHAS